MSENEVATAFASFMEHQNTVFGEMFCRLSALQEYLESRDPTFVEEFQRLLEIERRKAESAFTAWQNKMGGPTH